MTIAEALRAAVRYIEANLGAIAWDRGRCDSAEDEARITAEVLAIGRDLEALAEESEAAVIDHRRYEAMNNELQRRGFFLDKDIRKAIVEASHAQSDRSPSINP